MDRTLEVRTPESIAFNYELAGLGSRFLALTVDMSIQILTLVVLVVGVMLVARVTHGSIVRAAASNKLAESVGLAIVIAVLFIVLFGYFIVFEALWDGQTPGKKLLGLRVVRDGGYPLDFGASLIRNLIRVGEQLIGFYALAAVSALLSPENKRLGDHAAGTIVVRDARLAEPRALKEPPAEPVYAPTAYLSGEERGLIKRFLERRDALSGDRRRELAAQLASRIRNRIPGELSRLDDESLLERL
jgi:uncharacterized RDD family membrane protein YckC